MLDGLPERLSDTSRRYTLTVLRIALGRAVRQQVVVRNVAALVDMPPKSGWAMQPLDVGQVRAFLASLAGDPERGVPPDPREALYTVAIATGARQGELLALRWSDVDMATGVVNIRRSLRRGALGPTKSSAGVRDVRLGGSALAVLRRHRAAQAQQRLQAGRRWQDEDFIFTTATGRPLDARNVTRWLQQALERASLPRQRFHDLRHAYATIALAQGVDLAVVSKSLGHAQVSTSANIYMHWVPAMRDGIAETMEKVLAG
jgi:integrase